MNVKTILLIRNQFSDTKNINEKIAAIAKKKKIHCIESDLSSLKHIENKLAVKNINQLDLIVILGGDGTMLSVINQLIHLSVPFTGINTGRLGFLTDSFIGSLSSFLTNASKGNFIFDTRIALHATIVRKGKINEEIIAVNDFIIRSNTFHIANLGLTINNEFIHEERGDGIVVCTPTGSTAYSMSSGGPIIAPSIDCLCVTPLSPHYLSHRPIVLSPTTVIKISVPKSARDVDFSNDGIRIIKLIQGDEIIIKKYPLAFTLAYHPSYSYFQVLKKKLFWGTKTNLANKNVGRIKR
ncbi:MAG: NAD(+)/NADH kinase [Methylacidiphilales bacterium]|nr:NAD(+)/NADH kinase [Candidatus Methylacidiphilales bacterium]